MHAAFLERGVLADVVRDTLLRCKRVEVGFLTSLDGIWTVKEILG
jgi:hypothetical protein